MKAGRGRKWDWCTLMVDMHPDELKHCQCEIAFLYVHPNDYKPQGDRTVREVWVRIPGKHRDKDSAWSALDDLMLSAARPKGPTLTLVK